jgi:hypothetical protein
MTRKERNERMARVLAAEDASVMWVHGEQNKQASLHSQEGDCICTLPDYLLDIIDAAADADAASILEAIGDCASYAAGQGFNRGRECGQGEIIDSVHTLLGIDRICAALEKSKS